MFLKRLTLPSMPVISYSQDDVKAVSSYSPTDLDVHHPATHAR